MPEDLEIRVKRLEDRLGQIEQDSSVGNTAFGTLKQAKSMLSVRSKGNVTCGRFAAGIPDTAPGYTTSPMLGNYLQAVPFYCPAPVETKRIGFYVDILSVGNAHIGIYSDKGEGILQPHKLVVDAGEISTGTTGAKGVDVRVGLSRGLYWIAIVFSATPTIRVIAAPGCWAPQGCSESGVWYTSWGKSFTYAALPDPFPSSGAEVSGAIPFLFVQL